jgi:hypothetical protein
VTEASTKPSPLDELKEHIAELRDFEDPDWDGTAEDREFLWNLREALSRSVSADEVEIDETRERIIDSENDELPLTDAESLLAELETTPEEQVDQKKEVVEDAERSL